MYAVIASGGKQYRVSEGEVIKLEKLPVEAGKSVIFDQILLVADGDDIQVGTPYLSGVKVNAEVIEHGRGEKIRILKFRRRKHHMKQMGHRQDYIEVKITEIDTGKPRRKKEAGEESKPTTKQTHPKTASKKAAPKPSKNTVDKSEKNEE